MRAKRAILTLLLVASTVAGCRDQSTPDVSRPTPTSGQESPTPMPEPTPERTTAPPSSPEPSPTLPPSWSLWVAPALEPSLSSRVLAAAEDIGVTTTDAPEEATVTIRAGEPANLARWVYAVAVPFPTPVDDISWEAVRAYWAGDTLALGVLSEDGAPPKLLVTSQTLSALVSLLGTPAANVPISVLPADQLVDASWEGRPGTWAIVPFDQLEPRWKVLRLDGMSLLDKTLDMNAYPLTVGITVAGDHSADLLARAIPDGQLLTNRDIEKMTVLIMTGVTALVRATAHEMEVRGVLYPAERIGEILRSADLTHISNEIPFYSKCPPPDRNQETLVFCSSPSYIDLLRAVGTDIIELTGNHFQDYGDEATIETLRMYGQEGWSYYGGGADLEEASRSIILEDHANTLSFIGCNPVGPEFAWATEDHPGAAPCDWDYMRGELELLKRQVDIPIATFQYWEHYQYEATPQQELDFRSMADAGAAIVSGSQAHHPQAIEFYNGCFIHYGLGNLFFDQMWSLGTRQEVVDRHVIYDGRHISTELLTFMLENWSQPRSMTDVERQQLLSSIFAASGW